MDNLMVSVLGNRNSGKSYTWDTLFGSTVRTGSNERRLYFNDCEYVNVFLVSGSPEEREIFVGDIITAASPKIVLCSIQYTENAQDTLNYFIENDYFLFTHWLNPGYSDLNLSQFDNLGLMNWILSKKSIVGIRNGKSSAANRVEEIKDYIYGWAKSRGLVFNEYK